MPTREPVALGTAVSLVLYALAGLGWLTLDDATIAQVATAIAFVAQLVVAVLTRRSVTPLVEPLDEAGNPLVRSA